MNNSCDRCLELIEQLHLLMNKEDLSWSDCKVLIYESEALLGRLYARRNRTLLRETREVLDQYRK